jgi:hypothetical protein
MCFDKKILQAENNYQTLLSAEPRLSTCRDHVQLPRTILAVSVLRKTSTTRREVTLWPRYLVSTGVPVYVVLSHLDKSTGNGDKGETGKTRPVTLYLSRSGQDT